MADTLEFDIKKIEERRNERKKREEKKKHTKHSNELMTCAFVYEAFWKEIDRKVKSESELKKKEGKINW